MHDPEAPGGASAPDHRHDLEELAAHEAALEAVALALRRLDDGSSGTCEVCGAGLGEAARADPLARRCAEHPAAEGGAGPGSPDPADAGGGLPGGGDPA